MEFVIVKFSEPRGVLINNTPSGQTNQTLMVQEGHQEFKLEGDDDYTPKNQIKVVQNTTSTNPMLVEFSKNFTEEEGQPQNSGGNS